MKTRRKRNTKVKYTLKMLMWMLVGAAGGAMFAVLGMRTEAIGQFFGGIVTGIQKIMIPLVILITAVGIIGGEFFLKKMKQLTEKLVSAEDEEYDFLQYEEEKAGAWGMNISTLTQGLSILIISAGYSGEYLSGSYKTGFYYMISLVIFLVCFVYEGIWQMRYVKVIQDSRPEFADADPSSMGFHKEWLKRCDEAEKEVIYQSSYHTYMMLARLMPLLLVITMLANPLYDTGILAVIVVVLLWSFSTLYYTNSCVTMRKKRAKRF